MTSRTRMAVRMAVKRVTDVVGAGAALCLCAPLLLVIALVVRVSMGSPVLFKQRRLGRGGAEFTLIKFRTMGEDCDSSGKPLPDERRLTRVGQALRAASLDELPELVNVVRGEMSLVGPRPLLPEYRDHYTEHQWRRHEVKPGVVGPVTAYGRNVLDWERKMDLDVWYAENWSLSLDLKLLLLSLWGALRRQGIAAEGHVTMPRFDERDTSR